MSHALAALVALTFFPVPAGGGVNRLAGVARVDGGAAEVAFDLTVAGALRALAAEDAARRASAERWLAAHLTPRDLPEVAAAFAEPLAVGGAAPVPRAGDGAVLAVREALVRVLASEDHLFGLAALLASDVDPEVAAAGRAALRGQAARWSPALLEPPLSDSDLPLDLTRGERENADDFTARAVTLALDRGGFADVLERLDRLGGLPVPLAVDPEVQPGVRRGPSEPTRPQRRVTAPWTEVVRAEVARQRLALRVHGFAAYDDRSLAAPEDSAVAADVRGEEALALLRAALPRGNGAAFVWVGLRGRGAEASAAERLAVWVTLVAQVGGDPARREAAARALASVRWPAATAWLAERWLATGDPAALEGTLAALARGQVDPRVVTRGAVRALLDDVDRRLAEDLPGSQRYAERVARALAALPPVDATGAALADELVPRAGGGAGGLDPVAAWVRLAALEAHGRVHGPTAAAAALVLADPATPAPLAVQALATWVAVAPPGSAPPRLARPGALAVAAVEAGRAEAISRALAASGALADWSASEVQEVAGEDAASRAAERVAWHHLGPLAARGSDLAAWRPSLVRALADDSARAELAAVAARARERAGDDDGGAAAAFADLVQRAAGGPSPQVEAFLTEAGLADRAHRAAQLARAESAARAPGRAEEALLLLAGLVADPELGAAARTNLVELVRAAAEGRDDSDPTRTDPTPSGPTRSGPRLSAIVAALERASATLSAARLDPEAEELFGALRGLAGRHWSALASELYDGEWPRQPAPVGRDLDARERRYGG